MPVDRTRFLLLTASLATTLTTTACGAKDPQKKPAEETGGEAEKAEKADKADDKATAPAAASADGRAKPPSTPGTATRPGNPPSATGGPASTDEDPPSSVAENAHW